MHHQRSRRSSRARARAVAFSSSLIAVLGGAALVAAPAASATTVADMRAAAADGAAYLATAQDTNGGFSGFGGEWTLSAFAAAGVDPAGVRTSPSAPSVQDFYLSLWTGGPDSDDDWTSPSWQRPGAPAGTLLRPASDYAKAILAANAAGLPPTRLSADQNLVAQLAGIYRGRPATPEDPDTGLIEGNFGQPNAFDGAVSVLQALGRTAAPQVLLDALARVIVSNQHDNGGWSWARVTGPADRAGDSDIDQTGAALAALCDAGAAVTDSSVAHGFAYLRSMQLANGGFVGEWTPQGNTNSAAAVVEALNACGIDPRGPSFTSSDDKTPVDFLLARQLTSGAEEGGFAYTPDQTDANFYASQEAVRALSGESYSADPLSLRPMPKVADGTVVPQAVVIDAGIDATGERDLRVCRITAPVGATVSELLQRGSTGAQPAGCVTGLDVQDGTVRGLNGVDGDRSQRTWLVRIEGGPALRAGTQPVCQGQIVSLYVGRASDAADGPATPCTAKPPVVVTPQPPSPPQPTPTVSKPTVLPVAAIAVPGSGVGQKRAVRLDRHGRIRVTLRCPASAGATGCWSIVTARAKIRSTPRGEARERRVGGRTIAIKSGTSRTFRVRLTAALRRDLRRAGTRSVRLQVRTRGDGPNATKSRSIRVKVSARR